MLFLNYFKINGTKTVELVKYSRTFSKQTKI